MTAETLARRIEAETGEWLGLSPVAFCAAVAIVRKALADAYQDAGVWRRWYLRPGLWLAIAALERVERDHCGANEG